MKSFKLILLFILFAASAVAQPGQTGTSAPKWYGYRSSNPPTCNRVGNYYTDSSTGFPVYCTATGTPGTWAAPSGGGSGSGDVSSNTSSSVSSEISLFSGTGGKTIKRATGSGLAFLTSGVLSTVTAPSGTVVGDTDTQTLTNKTISGASNTINNLNASNLASGTAPPARLGSGTADSTTFLRGDNTWVVPAGTGANTALSNLASVSINSALIPQTTIDLGAAATPFRNLYLYGAGTFGTTSLKLTGTPTGNRILTFPDVTDTVAVLGLAQTFSAAQTFTPPANTSAIISSGYSLNSTNAQSLVDLSGTWNGTGTPTAIKVNITDTASNGSSLLMDLQLSTVSKFKISKSGRVDATEFDASTFLGFNSKSLISSPTNGNLLIQNNGQTDFGLLQFGGTTSSFPALKRSTSTLQARLADDSAFANISVGTGTFVANSTTGITLTNSGAGIATIGTNSSNSMVLGSAGNLVISNQLIQIGGTTSAFPALKRNSTGIDFRLADDSAYAPITIGGLNLDRTITTAGTTGNQTINKVSGTVNVAAAGTSITITNSLVTTSSLIYVMARANDSTCAVKNYVPSSGSFVINMTAACTAETSIGFMITN